jgi:regulator of sigma E protease
MLEILVKALAFVVAISVLVAVHEYGHFWVARKLGFKVLRFSIGFGRPLLRWRSKDADQVEYWVSAIPLGGYVKMLDEREDDVPAAEAHRAFNRRPIPARIAVLLAGPGANFIFAVFAFWLIYVTGVEGYRPYIEDVRPGTVAAAAGLRADDIIEAVGGTPTETLDQALVAMFDELLGDGVIELTVVAADGGRRELKLDVRERVGELTEPDALFAGLGIIIGPSAPAVVGSVTAGEPADQAGIREGDRIVALDGKPVTYFNELAAYVSERPGQLMDVAVDRNGESLGFSILVGSIEDEGQTIGRLGIGSRPDTRENLAERVLTERRYGPVEGLGVAAQETWAMTALTTRMIGRMLTGEISLRNASGPLMIANYAGEYAKAGFNAFLRFLSMISISLGIMNLLPVPILDGGQIVMCTIEGIKGSPLSLRAAVIGQQVGLAMLVALMGVVFYNDITRLLGL